MPWLERGTTATYYEVQGSGAPLLLLPGLASDTSSWGPLRERLAARFQVVSLDHRGAGRSRGPVPFTLADLADDAAALLEHLELRAVRVLGHSMGALVALGLAHQAPHRVDRLVLAGSFKAVSARNRCLFRDWAAGFQEGCDLRAWYRTLFAWIFQPSFFEDPVFLEQATEAALAYPFAPTPEGFRNQVAALEAGAPPAWFGPGAVPALVLAGARDGLVPPEDSRALAAVRPGGRFLEVAEAAHALLLEQPEACHAAMLPFLEPEEVP